MDIWAFSTIIAKFALYVGVLFGAGTVFYRLLFESKAAKSQFSSQRVILQFAMIGMMAALLGYGLQAARLTGDAASLVDPEMLGILWQTPVGTALTMRAIGLALLLIGPFLGSWGKIIGVSGSLVALASFTQIGHVTNISGLLPQAILLVHLIGIALWIGILWPLLQLSALAGQIEVTGQIAHRFGNIAAFFVPLLLLAGGWLAFGLVGSWPNLFATLYGQTLLAKIILVTCLLGLAAANKLRFVPKLRAGDMRALQHLNWSVRLEMLFAVTIVALTAILTSILTLPELPS